MFLFRSHLLSLTLHTYSGIPINGPTIPPPHKWHLLLSYPCLHWSIAWSAPSLPNTTWLSVPRSASSGTLSSYPISGASFAWPTTYSCKNSSPSTYKHYQEHAVYLRILSTRHIYSIGTSTNTSSGTTSRNGTLPVIYTHPRAIHWQNEIDQTVYSHYSTF